LLVSRDWYFRSNEWTFITTKTATMCEHQQRQLINVHSFDRCRTTSASTAPCTGFRVSDLGCRVSGVGFRVSAVGCWISGVGFRVLDFGCLLSGVCFRVSAFACLLLGVRFRVSGLGSRVPGFGFRVSGVGFRASGFGSQVSGFGLWTLSFRFRLWASGVMLRVSCVVFHV